VLRRSTLDIKFDKQRIPSGGISFSFSSPLISFLSDHIQLFSFLKEYL
jgi:hypothetical protein